MLDFGRRGKRNYLEEPTMPFVPKSVQVLRQSRQISQFELAKDLGCTPQTVLNWEQGKTAPNTHRLDMLYERAKHTNPDLVFYQPPPAGP